MEGTSWVCHSISNGSELYPGAVESDRSCAAVYGPDSLQEKIMAGVFFFLLSRSVGFLFFLHKFALPSFTCAWSKAQSTARLALTGPFLPGNGKELGNTWGFPPPPAHWEGSAQGCWRGPSTEQALSRGFLESIDDNPCHQCPHHCCLFSSSRAPSRRLFPTFLASSVPARRLSTPREHPPSAACLGVPRKLQPSHSHPLGTDHLGLFVPGVTFPPLGTTCMFAESAGSLLGGRYLLGASSLPSPLLFLWQLCHQPTLLDKTGSSVSQQVCPTSSRKGRAPVPVLSATINSRLACRQGERGGAARHKSRPHSTSQ